MGIAPFAAKEFFSFAGSLVRDSNASEAALRSAISRAYYSVFLTSRDRLFGSDSIGLTTSVRKKIDENYKRATGFRTSPGSHERIIFIVKTEKRQITLGQQLEQLKEARINADYRVDPTLLSRVNKQSWREYAEENMQLATLALPRAENVPSY